MPPHPMISTALDHIMPGNMSNAFFNELYYFCIMYLCIFLNTGKKGGLILSIGVYFVACGPFCNAVVHSCANKSL